MHREYDRSSRGNGPRTGRGIWLRTGVLTTLPTLQAGTPSMMATPALVPIRAAPASIIAIAVA